MATERGVAELAANQRVERVVLALGVVPPIAVDVGLVGIACGEG